MACSTKKQKIEWLKFDENRGLPIRELAQRMKDAALYSNTTALSDIESSICKMMGWNKARLKGIEQLYNADVKPKSRRAMQALFRRFDKERPGTIHVTKKADILIWIRFVPGAEFQNVHRITLKELENIDGKWREILLSGDYLVGLRPTADLVKERLIPA